MAGVFTPEDVWFGGDYELYIEVQRASSVQLLLRTLWSHPAIEGCKGVEFTMEPKKEHWGSAAMFKDQDGNQFLISSK